MLWLLCALVALSPQEDPVPVGDAFQLQLDQAGVLTMPASLTSSGKAFDKPPAPTSWMSSIGLPSPMAAQASITS